MKCITILYHQPTLQGGEIIGTAIYVREQLCLVSAMSYCTVHMIWHWVHSTALQPSGPSEDTLGQKCFAKSSPQGWVTSDNVVLSFILLFEKSGCSSSSTFFVLCCCFFNNMLCMCKCTQHTCFCCSYSSLLISKAFSKSASYNSVVIWGGRKAHLLFVFYLTYIWWVLAKVPYIKITHLFIFFWFLVIVILFLMCVIEL